MVSTRSQTRSSVVPSQCLHPSKPTKRSSIPSDLDLPAKRNKIEKAEEEVAQLQISPESQQPLTEQPMSPETTSEVVEHEDRPESPFIDVVGSDDEEGHPEYEDPEYVDNVVNGSQLEYFEEPVLFRYADEPEELESYIVVHEEEIGQCEIVEVVEDGYDEEEKELEEEELREYLMGFAEKKENDSDEGEDSSEEEIESEEESEEEEDESDSDDDEVRPVGALRAVSMENFRNKAVFEVQLMKEYYRLRAGENLRRTLCRLIDLEAPYQLFRFYNIEYHAQKLLGVHEKWRPLVEELIEKIRRIRPRACRNLKKELLEMQARGEIDC